MSFRTLSAAVFALAGIGLIAPMFGGCGGGTSVGGTINKKSFEATEAISGTVTEDGSSFGVVMISNKMGTCKMFSSGAIQKGMKFLQLGFGQLDFSTGKVVAPKDSGTFTVFNPNGGGIPTSTALAFVMYFETDENCQAVGEPIFGASGTIDVDSAGGGAYAGSGEVKLGNGDSITIDFDSTECGALTNLDIGGLSPTQATCN